MGVGRFACVALPIALTLASMVALLVATLSGVTHNNLYVFRVNVTDLSVNPASLDGIASSLAGRAADAQTSNITAGNLGLADVYDVNLWGFCATGANTNGTRDCTAARFDWASTHLNATWIEEFGSAAGVRIRLPDEVKDALAAFRAVAKWTEVAFIVALVVLAVELFVGIFATCSRAASCLTWLIATATAVLVGAAAGLATAMATVVVGSVETTARFYGVRGDVGTRFLATVWLAAAFAIGAAFFWLLTICCCKPEPRARAAARRSQIDDGEKLLPTRGYAPLSNDGEMSGAQQGQFAQPYPTAQPPRYPGGSGRADLAYEPYSHRA